MHRRAFHLQASSEGWAVLPSLRRFSWHCWRLDRNVKQFRIHVRCHLFLQFSIVCLPPSYIFTVLRTTVHILFCALCRFGWLIHSASHILLFMFGFKVQCRKVNTQPSCILCCHMKLMVWTYWPLRYLCISYMENSAWFVSVAWYRGTARMIAKPETVAQPKTGRSMMCLTERSVKVESFVWFLTWYVRVCVRFRVWWRFHKQAGRNVQRHGIVEGYNGQLSTGDD